MRPYIFSLSFPLPFMGFDFMADAIISAHSNDPEDCDIIKIYIFSKDLFLPEHAPIHKTTGELFKTLAYSRALDEAILDFYNSWED